MFDVLSVAFGASFACPGHLAGSQPGFGSQALASLGWEWSLACPGHLAGSQPAFGAQALASLAWAKAVRDGKDPLEAARRKWDDGFQFDGEGSDPAHRLCFPQPTFVPTQEFAALTGLFTTILSHLEGDDAAA